MNEPENFLTRWSRRKLVPEEPVEPAPAKHGAPGQTAKSSDPKDAPEPERAKAVANPAKAEFDPSTLPPLDSIGAQSDISAFLKPDVPGALRVAALRRAWSTDPAIRDFKGLQENDWDFNDPNGIPGFGALDPSYDVRKMLTDIFGETPSTREPRAEGSDATEPSTSSSRNFDLPTEPAALKPVGAPELDSGSSELHQKLVTQDINIQHRKEYTEARDQEVDHDYASVKRRRSQRDDLPH